MYKDFQLDILILSTILYAVQNRRNIPRTLFYKDRSTIFLVLYQSERNVIADNVVRMNPLPASITSLPASITS